MNLQAKNSYKSTNIAKNIHQLLYKCPVCGAEYSITDEDGKITGTLDRSKIWRAQTPQVFKKSIYFVSLKNCKSKGAAITDDAMMAEHAGFNVYCIETGSDNIKITTPADIREVLGVLNGRCEK